MRKLKTIMLASALVLAAGFVNAQDNGALLDLLVKKKVINDQEAEQVRADLVKEYANTSAGKLNVGSWVQEMKITGDIRERYMYQNQEHQTTLGSKLPGNYDQQSRWRFRLRIRDEFKLANNWFGGIELSTGQPSDSGNQTYGAQDGTAASSGFGKYYLYLSKVYVGWNATDWMTVTLGKQTNPFYTTDLVWDPDINPDGITEQVKFHKLYFGGSGESDGKGGFVDSGVHEERPWELTLNMGQFIFSDNKESNATSSLSGHGNSTDAYLFVFQLQGAYKFQNNVKATFAPGFMFFNAASLASLNNQTSYPASSITTSGTAGVGETRDLAILTAPGDVTFKLGGLPVKAYWDFAYNTQGSERYKNVYSRNSAGAYSKLSLPHTSQDDAAWLAGVQVGENKKAGDWSVFANYRQTGLSSVDPNLNDSDFALGYLNTQGVKVGAAYNFNDFCSFAVTYFDGWSLRSHLTGGQATGSGTAKVADAKNVQVLEVDLNVKF